MNEIEFGYMHCGRKVRFKSEAKAMVVANQVNKKYRLDKVAPYYCNVCDGWHNGRPSRGIISKINTLDRKTIRSDSTSIG